MGKKSKNITIISLLVVSMIVPFIYRDHVFASKDPTLEQMIVDSFTVIDDEGNTQIIPLEQVESEEGEEVSVQEKYDVVSHVGGDTEVMETFDSKKDAQIALTSLEDEQTTSTFSVQPFDTKAITIGVIYINTAGITEYQNVKSGSNGYTHGAYGVDAAYLGTYNGKIRGKIAGVVADFEPSDVNVVAYSSDEDVSYYMVEDGILRHYYYYGSSHALASTRVGYDLNYLKDDVKYYSYDGHYFYSSYETMIRDYQKDTYTNAINANEPYYNYYQFLSHRALSNLTAQDFNNIAIDAMGKTSYETSKFKDIGNALVTNQNKYSVNAMLMLGVAANESNWGRSDLAMDKNNLFGHGAYDSNPYYGANGYDSPAHSVQYHAEYFISRGYLDYEDWRFNGPHLGDKESGINVRYASDPYWGEKAACRAYFLTKKPADYGQSTIGIIEGSIDNYPLYKEPSTSSSKVATLDGLVNLPVLIIDTVTSGGKKWYKIQSDTSLTSDRTTSDYSLIYDPANDYLYIPADTVNVVWEGNGTTEVEKPITLGDVNGDGKITPADYVRVKNHILGKSKLTGDALKAADMNKDGKITPADYVKIKNRILGN